MGAEGIGFDWSCECGKVEARLTPHGVKTGTRLICYCNSCRGADLYLRGDASGLSADLGVDIFQTTPADFEIVNGQSYVKVMRITRRGPLRWYASCCGSPMLNSLANPKIPFIGVIIPLHAHYPQTPALGTPHRVLTKYAIEGHGAPKKDKGFGATVLGVLRRGFLGYFRPRNSWLQDESGALITKPKKLNEKERTALYALAKDF